MRQFRICLLAVLLPLIAVAQEPPRLAADAPERYEVRSGDTLWDIAGRFLRDPWRWREVWRANPQVADPDLIYPGDVLRLSTVDGVPTLSVEQRAARREVQLSPGVRRERLTRPVPTIPVDAIQQFLSRPHVLAPRELRSAPRISAFAQEHIIGGAGDALYAEGLQDDPDLLTFDVVRPDTLYRDPDTGEFLGQEAMYLGRARLVRFGEPAKLVLEASTREVQIDDRLLVNVDEEPLSNFLPRPGPDQLQGKILAVLDGVNQIGVLNVVVLNRGRDDGLEPGHVLDILQRAVPPRGGSGTWLRSRELPLERVGVLMVFRVFDRVSYALVMHAGGPIHLTDTVRSPES